MNNTTAHLLSKSVIASTVLLASTFANAVTSIDEQMTVTSPVLVDLNVQRGEVEILGWDKGIIRVTGTLDERSQAFIFEQKGNEIVIEDKLPKSYNGNNEQGSDLVIYVPTHINLEASGISADYEAANLNGKTLISVVSGSIEAENMTGEISLNTVSGEIETEQLNGKITLETVSGDIKDKNTQGTIEYRLVSGELESENSQVSELNIDSVSGDIEGKFLLAQKIKAVTVSGDMDLKLSEAVSKGLFDSVSGDIKLSFAATPNVTFDIDGGPGGDIDNRLTTDKPVKEKYSPAKSLTFSTGSADGRIEITTISGDVELENK
ncbi:DUF4097 family beta strand repeat-containing protein [Shewanella gaetbuli]|uniref:DUF4097 domain-containing protein n=1 Tax=Shewanella gaetbuli TaxID=220752 RepID=A0A9X1ZHY4_9GAMM|nr:DUF4097 family beta strand repeat-containing protein [Shewanella gaetbuli]MCL1141342.1 DUF4097 domain-containing protein [Shewanella gaetbuli]